jgi:hypothetical protein
VNAKQLAELADDLFQKRTSLMLLWQEIAENFYPERADFTYTRTLGTDFAQATLTSYPFLCRRDLGDQVGSMLRPAAKDWFHMTPKDPAREDTDSKRWLEWASGVQRRAMYDRVTQFTKAEKQGDHDFVTFGQFPMSIEMNYRRQALLYRTYHLRDVAWQESEEGEICAVFRKWKPQARELVRLYPQTAHNTVKQSSERKPFDTVECLHMVIEADMYSGDSVGGPQRGRQPRYLVCYDKTHDTVLEAVPIWGKHYIIPRWATIPGSQYANSPAVVAALPDARLIQAMTLTLLEAGEKAANPPMVATQDAVRSDINIYPGGVTWVDMEYDERLGDALRPLTSDAKGMPIGIDMQRDSRALLIAQAFYLNKLKPFTPTSIRTMTAFQAGQMVAQYIRDALPLFEPMEAERNGAICEESFELLMRARAFGSPLNMPRALRGADIDFHSRPRCTTRSSR